ncbi:MAG: hypothetical protein Roseis2KO_54950 [Roseivirga sp.]
MIIILSHLLTDQINAQTFTELRVGYTVNQLNQGFTSDTFEEKEASGGAYTGFTITHYFSDKLFLKYGGEWIEKSYTLRRAVPFNAVYKRLNNRYLQLPLNVGIVLTSYKKLQFAASTGFYAGYWLSSNVNGTIPNAFDTFNTQENGNVTANFRVASYKAENQIGTGEYRRFHIGSNFELKAIYTLNHNCRLTSTVGYQHAFTNQGKSAPSANGFQADRTVVFSIGLMYKL